MKGLEEESNTVSNKHLFWCKRGRLGTTCIKSLNLNASTRVKDTYSRLLDALFLCMNWFVFSVISGVLGMFRKQVAIVELLQPEGW